MFSPCSVAEVCICAINAQTQFCPETFGSDLPNQIHESSNTGVYLNLESPAQCNGTVTAYHYCYYDINDEETVSVTLLVYRREGDTYRLVEGSLHLIQKGQSQLIEGEFACDMEPLEESEQFQVQEGDIIAACIPNVRPLDILAEEAVEHTVYTFNSNTDSCSPGVLTPHAENDLVNVTGSALHLFADIGMPTL